MSQRVFVTLPSTVHPALEEWAETQDQSTRSHRLLPSLFKLTAFFVEAALKTAKERGEFVSQTKPRSLRK